MDQEQKQILEKIANTIRQLSIEAVQKADSGHPGLPLGCAELGAYLYGVQMRYNPKNPKWMNRDRFVLSAGHGSMLLYSCLHLAGYDLSIDDIKNFRQLHSKTPGHPESFETPGVETTTGPLGQGIGNAVGMALGLKVLEAKFENLLNNKVYVLMGDGDTMEGISAEVSSLAGHLKLNNIVVIYDANQISLDGPLAESMSEDTKMRYKAYGWDVYNIDGNNLDDIDNVFTHIRENKQERPILVIAKTVIGKGSPNKAGTSKVHGSPLGEDEVKLTKQALGLPDEAFYVPQAVQDYFKAKLEKDQKLEQEWNTTFEKWGKANPELLSTFEKMKHRDLPPDFEKTLQALEIKSPVAGRKASQDVLNAIGDALPYLIGGSADLSVSDLTMMKKYPVIYAGHFNGRNIKYGVREFGMAAMATGIAETDMFVPFIGTFLTFSDYMRNAIRLCALQKQHVVYQFTHDSIFLGEDGPTHQPVEHYAALRAIPNLNVIRPADANEVKAAWIAALTYKDRPTALLLSRQNLPDVPGTAVPYSEGMGRGAYIIKKEKAGKIDYTLMSTGSEVWLAMDVAKELEKLGKNVRVISMPCWEILDAQPQTYQASLFGGDIGKRVSIEAGVSLGWHKYIGLDGIAICMEGYGASAPYQDLQKTFGFTVEDILERIL